MEKTKFNQNQSVFKVGELPDKMYLLVKGSVGIFLPTNETNKPNFIIQENELFGEMGVIENELRMATARCLVESEIISITKDEFDKRVNNSDVFVKGCLKALSYRSPACTSTPIIRPITMILPFINPAYGAMIKAITTPLIRPATPPEMVLPGLIDGANFLPPIALPPK